MTNQKRYIRDRSKILLNREHGAPIPIAIASDAEWAEMLVAALNDRYARNAAIIAAAGAAPC